MTKHEKHDGAITLQDAIAQALAAGDKTALATIEQALADGRAALAAKALADATALREQAAKMLAEAEALAPTDVRPPTRRRRSNTFSDAKNVDGKIALSGLTRDAYLLAVRQNVRRWSNNTSGGETYRAAGASIGIDLMIDAARSDGLSPNQAYTRIIGILGAPTFLAEKAAEKNV